MKRKPISMTVILTAALISTVMMIASSAIGLFLSTYRRTLLQNTQTASRQTVSQVSSTVLNYLDDVYDLSQLLREEIQKPRQERDEFFDAFLKVRPDVVTVTTYDREGELVDCRSLGHRPKAEIYKNLSFSLMEARRKQAYITTPHVVTLFDGYYPWVVSMVLPVESETEAWMSIDIQFSDISSYINGVGIGSHGYCFLMDVDGNILYHPQQQLLYSNLKIEDGKKLAYMVDGSHVENNVIYSIQTLPDQDLRVVGVSFVEEIINSSVENVATLLALTGILILLASIVMSVVLTRLLSRPIRSLTDAMGQFERGADTFTYTPVSGIQEVQTLSLSFSHMVEKIQQLMETVRKEEINLRKTELRALQAQINPHFLYNTLDSIAWMCERGKTAEAVKMVNALARLFRISISRGHELIPIRSELQHAESYLQIQAYRYRNQFSYEFHTDESCLDYLCNKITLQPIIENAIYHGINGLVDEGKIDIYVQREGEDILLAVEDNGNGMEPEQVQAILKKERSDHAGIGIKNVNDRLKIYFGPGYGLTIHSVPDEGTRVEIRMPRVEEAADYENR